ncbi:hypothetical protein E4Z66_10505 [Aliishimia ponticola]|uniref:VPLPA-CTERM sorting domain-containing protein n=1 Tax=Aliishimia ponticola TaxID=2499833 RepID=A0A4S4NCZ5_9RHOB|nr:hypothetical protein [Aliishimia ponticola]THH37336.1 hypothetical protein E4Z66_10505 [Aliishimia ponticola]
MNVISKAFILGLIATQAHAASALFEDFDAGPGAWRPNTVETNTSWINAGGNPGGFLATNNFGAGVSFGVAGARAEGGAYSGALPDGTWTVSVDLLYYDTPITEARLRWRYQDPTFNGWYIPIEQSDFDLDWTSYSVTFDTNWDDATAMANGWVQETSSVAFSTLWDDIYTAEVRLLGPATPGLSAAIDNYSIQPAAVSLPAGIVLLGSALAGTMAFKRKRR